MLALLLTAPMAAQLQPQQLWPPPVRPPWPPHFKPIMNNSIPGPASPEEYGAWWAWVQSWRETQLKLLNLSRPGGTALDNPKLEWTRTSFVQAQVPLYDRFLYDRATGRYTVRRFLDDLRKHASGALELTRVLDRRPRRPRRGYKRGRRHDDERAHNTTRG